MVRSPFGAHRAARAFPIRRHAHRQQASPLALPVGWQYDRSGSCTRMPSTQHRKGIRVQSLPVGETDGIVWVYPGDQEPRVELPQCTRPPPGFLVQTELVLEVRTCFSRAAASISRPGPGCVCVGP